MKNRPLTLDESLIVLEEQFEPQADFPAIFGNDRPVEIEIGSGSGTLLLHMAQSAPDTNFLGIEWASKYYRYTIDRLHRRNIKNVKMLRTDARAFTIHKLKPRSVGAFHIYFADPWPKKRHHKRRLFIPELCQAVARALVPGGKIYVATDHQDYFRQIQTNLLAVPDLSAADFDSPAGNEVLSNFETKFTRQGKTIYRLAVQKCI